MTQKNQMQKRGKNMVQILGERVRGFPQVRWRIDISSYSKRKTVTAN